MPSSKVYRAVSIGSTGAGGFGHGLHKPLQDLENIDFVALADDDEAGRKEAQEKAGVPRAYADYREMLKEEKPDLACVCPRWPARHLEMVMACLEAGADIYCEKPMTSNLQEGDEIVRAADAAGKKIAVAHQAVHLDGLQRTRQVIDEGRIGNVNAIHAHGKQDARGGGEDMIVLGTHLLNGMRFLAGDVDWMSAHVTFEGRELEPRDAREATEPLELIAGDCINCYYAFKSGAAGFFDSRKDQPGRPNLFGWEIIGSEGRIMLTSAGSVATIYPYPALVPEDFDKKWQALDGVEDQNFQVVGNQRAVLDLIDAIENDGEPLSSARDAIAALEMILGVYESQITGARVHIPMRQRKHPLVAWKEGAYDN